MLPRITKLYKHGQTIMQRVVITSTRYHTRYRTFSLSLTWICRNAVRYHNFNVLPHAIPYFFQFYHGLGLFATCYQTLPSDL